MTRTIARGAAALISAVVVLASGCGTGSPSDGPNTPVDVNPPPAEATTDPAQPEPTDATQTEPTAADTNQTTPGDGSAVVIGDRQEHRVVDEATAVVHCEGPGDVKVVASGIEVTITGTCDEVDVEGNGATVQMEAAHELDIDGHGNHVTATTVDDLDIEGNDNVVTLDEVRRELDIDGNGNTVSFAAGNPRIDDDGNGNQIN